jgi:hypothetical protein
VGVLHKNKLLFHRHLRQAIPILHTAIPTITVDTNTDRVKTTIIEPEAKTVVVQNRGTGEKTVTTTVTATLTETVGTTATTDAEETVTQTTTTLIKGKMTVADRLKVDILKIATDTTITPPTETAGIAATIGAEEVTRTPTITV